MFKVFLACFTCFKSLHSSLMRSRSGLWLCPGVSISELSTTLWWIYWCVLGLVMFLLILSHFLHTPTDTQQNQWWGSIQSLAIWIWLYTAKEKHISCWFWLLQLYIYCCKAHASVRLPSPKCIHLLEAVLFPAWLDGCGRWNQFDGRI